MNIAEFLKLSTDSVHKFLALLGLTLMVAPTAGAVWVAAQSQEKVRDRGSALSYAQGNAKVLDSRAQRLSIDLRALLREQKILEVQMDSTQAMPDSDRKIRIWKAFGSTIEEHARRGLGLMQTEETLRTEIAKETADLDHKRDVAESWHQNLKTASFYALFLSLCGAWSFAVGLRGWMGEQSIRDALLRNQLEAGEVSKTGE